MKKKTINYDCNNWSTYEGCGASSNMNESTIDRTFFNYYNTKTSQPEEIEDLSFLEGNINGDAFGLIYGGKSKDDDNGALHITNIVFGYFTENGQCFVTDIYNKERMRYADGDTHSFRTHYYSWMNKNGIKINKGERLYNTIQGWLKIVEKKGHDY